MTTADDYINRVLSLLPRATPMRAQIAVELRGHIEERVAHGQTVGEVLRQLGDPALLAESYLSAVPLEPASFPARAGAKCVDFAIVVAAIAVPVGALTWFVLPGEWSWFAIVAAALFGSLGFCVYTVVGEYLAWTDHREADCRPPGGARVGRAHRVRPVDCPTAARGTADLLDRRAVRPLHRQAAARVRDAVEDAGRARRQRAPGGPRLMLGPAQRGFLPPGGDAASPAIATSFATVLMLRTVATPPVFGNFSFDRPIPSG